MKNGYNRFNNRRGLTPRQRQQIFRKINLLLSTIVVAVVLSIFVGGLCNQAKAADNYNKYYTSVEIMKGDTMTSYYDSYGSHFKSFDKFSKEVCMINSIEADDLIAGHYVILPYYSEEIKWYVLI